METIEGPHDLPHDQVLASEKAGTAKEIGLKTAIGGKRLWDMLVTSRTRKRSISSSGEETIGRIQTLLQKLAVVNQDETLCAMVDGKLLGKVEDSEFIRLKWYCMEGKSMRRLNTVCPGFYQPTALEVNKVIVCEGRTTFDPKHVVSRVEFGPIKLDAKMEASLTKQLNQKSPLTLTGLFFVNGRRVFLMLEKGPNGKTLSSLRIVDQDEGDRILFEFKNDGTSLQVVLDACDPLKVHFHQNENDDSIVTLYCSKLQEVTQLVLCLKRLSESQISKVQIISSTELEGYDSEESSFTLDEDAYDEFVGTLRDEIMEKDQIICDLQKKLDAFQNNSKNDDLEQNPPPISPEKGKPQVENNVRKLESELFRLQSLVKEEQDHRIHSDCMVKKLQADFEALSTKHKCVKAKADGLSKDMARLYLVTGVETISELEDILKQVENLKKRLHSRELEKIDIMQENLALRNELEMMQKQPSLRKRRTSLTSSSKKTEKAQYEQMRQLANSLMESLNEKDELLEQQRYANKVLADKISELERLAARWQR